jgi:hypothetical protein
MNINRFLGAHIDGMPRTNKFTVEVHGPQGIRSRGIRCTGVSLPGRQVTSSEFSEYGGAPMTKYPQRVDYGGGKVDMTWMCDHTMEDRQKMELWQSFIYDEAYVMNYPEKYEGTVKITQLGQDNLPIYSVELLNCFPDSIGDIALDSGEGNLVTFTVSMSFRTWISAYENTPSGLLGGLFNKFGRKLKSKVNRKVENKLFG